MTGSGIHAEDIQNLVNRIAQGSHDIEGISDIRPPRARRSHTTGRQHTNRHNHCKYSGRKKPACLLFPFFIQKRQINKRKQCQITLMDKTHSKIKHTRPDQILPAVPLLIDVTKQTVEYPKRSPQGQTLHQPVHLSDLVVGHSG